MTRCSPICGKRKQEGKKKEVKKIEKDEDEETLRKLVPKGFRSGGRSLEKGNQKECQCERPGIMR